jgi:hypothetical protein
VTDLCGRADLSPADIDVTQLTDKVEGYAIARRTTVRSCIEPLSTVYDFDGTESDHVIKFVKRGAASIRTLPADDLAAYDSGTELPPEAAGERGNDLELPYRVDISYMRRESDYQNSTQSAVRETAPGTSVTSIDLPMVLKDADARHAAQTVMLQAWIGRQKVSWQTTRKYLDIDPCDVVTLPLAAGPTTVRVLQKDESRNGLVKWQGEVYDASAYVDFGTSTFGGPDGQVISPNMYANLPSLGYLMDLPPLRDQDSEAGFYWAAAGTGPGAWPGAVLVRSLDGGATYSSVATLTKEATLGYTITTLQSGPTHIFDEARTVTVYLVNGTLASATREAVMNGANAALVGDEIIHFREATLIAENTYVLSGLLRGRAGTEFAVTTHQTNERFVLLQPVGIYRVLGNLSEVGQTRSYKMVTAGQRVTEATAEQFTAAGRALKPFSPVQLSGGRDADGNLTVQWRRRTRFGGELRDSVDVPLNEASELYDVEVWNSTYTTLKRTASGLTSPSATYTAAQQIEDFGSLQSKVYVKIYQLSTAVGRGEALKGAI